MEAEVRFVNLENLAEWPTAFILDLSRTRGLSEDMKAKTQVSAAVMRKFIYFLATTLSVLYSAQTVFAGDVVSANVTESGTQEQKLGDIYVSLEFKGASIEETTYFFSVISKRLDAEHQGVNIHIDTEAKKSSRPISLALYDVPLGQAMLLTCELGNVKALVGKNAVSIVSPAQDVPASEVRLESLNSYKDRDRTNALDYFRLKNIDLEKVELSDALETLHRGTLGQDHSEPDEDYGLSFAYFPKVEPRNQGSPRHLTVTLKRDNATIREILDEITRQTDTRYSLEGRVVCIRP